MKCIIQNLHTAGRKMTRFLFSNEKFEDYVMNLVTEHKPYTRVENVSMVDLNDKKYPDGMYFSVASDSISLYKKELVLSAGYIYNSTTSKVDVLQTWHLVDVDYDFSKRGTDDACSDIICNPKKDVCSQFSVDNVKYNSKILMVGRRCSGVTTRIKNILKSMNLTNNTNSLIIVSAERYGFEEKEYSSKEFKAQIMDWFSEDVIKDYASRPGGYIVIDRSSINTFKQDVISSIMNCPKLVIISAQTICASAFNKDFVKEMDMVVLGRGYNDERTLHECFGSKLTFEEFMTSFNSLTTDFNAMVIKN